MSNTIIFTKTAGGLEVACRPQFADLCSRTSLKSRTAETVNSCFCNKLTKQATCKLVLSPEKLITLLSVNWSKYFLPGRAHLWCIFFKEMPIISSQLRFKIPVIHRVKWEQIIYFNIHILDLLTCLPRCCLAQEIAKENINENKNCRNIDNILPAMFRISVLL